MRGERLKVVVGSVGGIGERREVKGWITRK